ncbi:MAG: nucleotidyltransferase family protein [Rhodocyclaceae bacterium]|nr:nucleotidyltransferase family protein [Rhodocyclaceae bacterium]MBK6552352.1 nucleotidyltransferase family protein [Rhodocyclaceae bacterium]MBK9311889.1 nucleotidyltransferase family protein [Rhodocyclaceae bacterium]MBK9956759.1 nucleotidyltransferase family protein [Rhodocyclaceae bacterium]
MNRQLTIPRTAISEFCRVHGIRELAIFGSAVRNDFNPDSDVDVLIELAPDARIGLVMLQRMRDELVSIFGRPVDLVTRHGLNRHIRDQVLREAEVIHAE